MRALLVLAAALSGCASLSTLQTARTLDAGDVTYDVGVVAATNLRRDLFARSASVAPQVEAGLRRGLTDGVDAGYRIWFLGFNADVKVRLFDDKKLALAVAPGFGVEKTYAFYGLDFYLPLLAQWRLNSMLDLYVVPKAIGRVSLGHGWQLDYGAGGSLGVAVRIAENMVVLPEIDAIWPHLGGEDPCGLQLGPVSATCMRPGVPVVAFAFGLVFER